MSTSLKSISFKNRFWKSSGFNIDAQPCMTAMIGGTKRGNLTPEESIESDHGQNSPVVLLLFTRLTMILK